MLCEMEEASFKQLTAWPTYGTHDVQLHRFSYSYIHANRPCLIVPSNEIILKKKIQIIVSRFCRAVFS